MSRNETLKTIWSIQSTFSLVNKQTNKQTEQIQTVLMLGIIMYLLTRCACPHSGAGPRLAARTWADGCYIGYRTHRTLDWGWGTVYRFTWCVYTKYSQIIGDCKIFLRILSNAKLQLHLSLTVEVDLCLKFICANADKMICSHFQNLPQVLNLHHTTNFIFLHNEV